MSTTSLSAGFAFAATICLCAVHSVVGQTAASSTLGTTPAGDVRSLLTDLKDARKQADLLNQALGAVTASNSGPDFLKALHLHVKTFAPTSSDENATLGIDYEYDKAVTNARLFGEDNPAYLTFNIKARGNVSFDQDNNPADFLQSGFQFHLWQFFGQTDEDPVDKNGEPIADRVFAELAKYKGKSGPEIRATPEWQNFVQHAFDNDRSDFLYDVAGNLSFESNQTFSKKQLAYGLEVHATARVWDPNSPASKFNVLDWPFALTRTLGG